MKKRALLFLCLCLVLAQCTVAFTSPLVTEQITLGEKMKMQLTAGSGLSFSFQLFETENKQWKLGSLEGTEPLVFTGSYLKDKSKKQEEMKFDLHRGDEILLDGFAATSQELTTYQSSSLLDENLRLKAPWHKVLLTWLFSADHMPLEYDNMSVLFDLIDQYDLFDQQNMEPYFTDIDFWLQQYAQEPIYLNADNEAFMVEFDIPPQGIVEGINLIIARFLNQGQQGEEAQANATAQEDGKSLQFPLFSLLQKSYQQVLDHISFTQSLSFKRYYKSFGVLDKTILTLPLPEEFFGFQTLTLEGSIQGGNSLLLEGEQGRLGLKWLEMAQDSDKITYSGEVFYFPAIESEGQKCISFGYTLNTQKETFTDQENKANEKTDFSLLLVPLWDKEEAGRILTQGQKERYLIQENLEVQGAFNLISGSSKSNSVSFTLNAALEGLQFSGQLSGEGRSQAPWDFTTIGNAKEINLSQLPEYKQSIIKRAEVLLNINEQIDSAPSAEETTPPTPLATAPAATQTLAATASPVVETAGDGKAEQSSPEPENSPEEEEGGKIIFN